MADIRPQSAAQAQQKGIINRDAIRAADDRFGNMLGRGNPAASHDADTVAQVLRHQVVMHRSDCIRHKAGIVIQHTDLIGQQVNDGHPGMHQRFNTRRAALTNRQAHSHQRVWQGALRRPP